MAPTPTLDAQDASLNIGEHSDCEPAPTGDQAFQRGEGSHRLPCPAHSDALLPPSADPVVPVEILASVRCDGVGTARSGVRGSLDRPPR